MLLLVVIALIIIYYFVFSSLGNNEDGSSSPIKVFVETVLWLLFIILLLLNGISYIFGIDLLKSLDSNFGSERSLTDDEDDEDDEDDDDDDDDDIKLVLNDQVFHLPENKYSYDDAKAICKAYDARLATLDEMNEAYEKGADWCTYGWSADQMALYPTQTDKWKKLQKKKGHEQDCGRPGINGGYIYDLSMEYGANCYGRRPSISKSDAEKMREEPIYKKNKNELEFDQRVNYWHGKLGEIAMAPFNHDNWSMI
jgi:hypothetical protein